VLFVTVDGTGAYRILGEQEGTFRIRNGRVESSGSGGAASAWKGRSAARFFEALAAAGIRRQP
jgi:shikimate 5-dehydrogenase